jgi:Fe-S-cluster containining protein
MIDQYVRICRSVEIEFQRNRGLHGTRIRCGPGCSDCCHQLFQITEIEAAQVSFGFRQLPLIQQDALRSKAVTYLKERNRLVMAGGEPEAWGALPPPGTRLACPALADGVCTIYEYRPLICRKFGMPLFNPDKPDRVFACELNFKPGDEIDDPHLIQIQSAIHHEWKGVQAEYNDRGLHRDPNPITVARALVEDFSKICEPG